MCIVLPPAGKVALLGWVVRWEELTGPGLELNTGRETFTAGDAFANDSGFTQYRPWPDKGTAMNHLREFTNARRPCPIFDPRVEWVEWSEPMAGN